MIENHEYGFFAPEEGIDLPEKRYDLRILQTLRIIMREVDLHSRKLKKECQITTPQLVCLLATVAKGPLTVAGLASEVHLSPSTVVGILDRLEERGLISRERGVKDRRKVLVAASEKGCLYAKSAPSPLQDRLARSLSELSLLEQSTISLSLERIVELMKEKQQ